MRTVIDINECDDGTASCDVNAQCINTDGSYNCSCSSGYSGDGMTCTGKWGGTSEYIKLALTHIHVCSFM